jgi:hypothetical protein
MKNNDLGFDTIGNATMICYDKKPILVTDPWVQGSAYFGSWGLSHEIPAEQLEAISNTEYVWYSHGHPDHLNWDSIDLFRKKKILLPDHRGRRIYEDLLRFGFDVTILKDQKWYTLSSKIKIMCFSDIYQDAVLLIDINNRLIVNANDANRLLIWNKPVRRIIKSYKMSILLSLTGHGDAEMINFRDEADNLIQPPELKQKHSMSSIISANTNFFGVKAFIPFSSLHKYQRRDSLWAEEASVQVEEYTEAHLKESSKVFPPFIRYNCEDDSFSEINPKKSEATVYEPEYFGDSWADSLQKGDLDKIKQYFCRVETLKDHWDFIIIAVGGEEKTIDLNRKVHKVGIKFEAPRNSFMYSVENNIFEDMLIGNYMKTTWIGKSPLSRLYPDSIPLVKYADNGFAYTKKEVSQYLREYKLRYPFDSLVDEIHKICGGTLRKLISPESELYTSIRNKVKSKKSI